MFRSHVLHNYWVRLGVLAFDCVDERCAITASQQIGSDVDFTG